MIRKRFVECTPLFEAYEHEISQDDKAYVEDVRGKEKSMLNMGK